MVLNRGLGWGQCSGCRLREVGASWLHRGMASDPENGLWVLAPPHACTVPSGRPAQQSGLSEETGGGAISEARMRGSELGPWKVGSTLPLPQLKLPFLGASPRISEDPLGLRPGPAG